MYFVVEGPLILAKPVKGISKVVVVALSAAVCFLLLVGVVATCWFRGYRRRAKNQERLIIPRPNVLNPYYGEQTSTEGAVAITIEADEWEFDRKL